MLVSPHFPESSHHTTSKYGRPAANVATVLRNPIYFLFLVMVLAGLYVTYTLNMWGPILRMTNAASAQALEIGKEKLREFLEQSETGRQAIGMSAEHGIKLDTLGADGKRKTSAKNTEDDDAEDI